MPVLYCRPGKLEEAGVELKKDMDWDDLAQASRSFRKKQEGPVSSAAMKAPNS